MALITELGKYIRKLRIDAGDSMISMSKKIGVSTAFLSSVETGNKNASSKLLQLIIDHYGLSPTQARDLKQKAAESEATIKISAEIKDRHLVAAFARRLNSLDESQKSDIFAILKKDQKE